MSGKLFGIFIGLTTLVGGIAVYYLQVYAFYEEVDAAQVEIQLTLVATGEAEPLFVEDVQAIDATSSPLRFRACFTALQDQATLTETYVTYEDAEPLTGPGWFDCYDADEIGAALVGETAIAFLAEKNISEGVDRVVAVMEDGRGFAWHQLNETFAD